MSMPLYAHCRTDKSDLALVAFAERDRGRWYYKLSIDLPNPGRMWFANLRYAF